jgi:hypothetical protein
MDARHFDALTRTLSEAGSRRGLLGLLAALPLVGGLVALLAQDEGEARGHRHRRRVKRHKHGRGRRRQHHRKKQCQPNSKAATCAGTCGSVKNNCQKTVDCGSCACEPPCAVCFTCEDGPNTPGTCVVDPEQQGQACGDPGQVCQADGRCACDGSSCPGCLTCQSDGACGDPCGGTGCCDSGACVDGTDDAACGTGGDDCVACTPPETCGGGGTPGVCGCPPTTCVAQSKNCGTIDDGCGGTIDCGTCDPSGSTPICVNNVCSACSVTHPCSSGCCLSDGSCQPGSSDSACGGTGQTCDVCEVGEACSSGTCVVLPCGAGGICRVFATSSTQQGDLGGLTGADTICQNLAAAAGLPGTYKAWLSDDTGSPSTRFVQSTGPYRRVDNVTVANNWADLTDGLLLSEIDRSESGAIVGQSGSVNRVWTDTTTSGTVNNDQHCHRWSTAAAGQGGGFRGTVLSSSEQWTLINSADCDFDGRLYCFQQSE